MWELTRSLARSLARPVVGSLVSCSEDTHKPSTDRRNQTAHVKTEPNKFVSNHKNGGSISGRRHRKQHNTNPTCNDPLWFDRLRLLDSKSSDNNDTHYTKQTATASLSRHKEETSLGGCVAGWCGGEWRCFVGRALSLLVSVVALFVVRSFVVLPTRGGCCWLVLSCCLSVCLVFPRGAVRCCVVGRGSDF